MNRIEKFVLGHTPNSSFKARHAFARSKAPWAAVIVKLPSCYVAFECLKDYKAWMDTLQLAAEQK